MRFITILLIFVFLFVFGTGFSQSPSFSNALNTTPSVVCYDGQLSTTATVTNANFYQYEIKNNTTNTWENIAGASGDPSSTSRIINFTFYNIRESFTFRLMVSNANGSIYSSEITINPQRPVFNFQPIDITQCNGLTAVFKVSASGSGTLGYQWQQSIDGGNNFLNLSNTTKYSGVTTSQLSVKNLINSNHNYQYKCVVTDQNGCENYSNSGTLYVNQLSSSPSPTTTTKYCEGDTASFSLASVVGTTNSYQWQLRKTGEVGYNNILESAHYQGVLTNNLKVNGILPNETDYRVFVNYNSISQSDAGTSIAETCNLNATRAGYTIYARPSAPIQIDNVERCGEGKIITSITEPGNYYWYTDTLLAPMVVNSPNFTSPNISTNTKFFYSLKDVNTCESYKKEFLGIVREVPSQELNSNYSICPSENSFDVVFSNVQNDPLQIYVLNGTTTLPSYVEISEAVYSSNFSVDLPNSKNPGTYNFLIFTENAYCYSDTSEVSLYVKKPTQITQNPTGATICEGSNIELNSLWDAEAPIAFQWFKDNTILTDSTNETIKFKNIALANAGEYKLQITGQCGIETSTEASLNILAKTIINTQPVETEVCDNGNVSFTIAASGSGTVHYQWYKNEIKIGTDQNTLSFENVPLADNDAEIKCEVSSDCAPAIFSETVNLIVNALPSEPIIPDEIGFCKSNNPGELIATADGTNILNWFDHTLASLPNNEIDISNVGNQNFYVSQTDDNGCQSSLKPFLAVVSEPFQISINANIDALCMSGNFNREGTLTALIAPNDIFPELFELFESNNLLQNNTTGEFNISAGGQYKMVAKKDYCKDSAEISIEKLFPELNIQPSVIDQEVCKGNNATLEATGDFSGGKFIWWEGENLPFQIAEGSQFTFLNVQSPQITFVSYTKESNGVFCETDRRIANVSLKEPLKMEALNSPVTCQGLSDGSLHISPLSGTAPFRFTIDGAQENLTGIFENLLAETYAIHVIDAEGCTGDSSFVIETLLGTTISSHPQNIARCKGNQASFNVSANNFDDVIWERKLPGETVFSEISGATSLTLTLTNIGNTTNPHLSVYRAKFRKGSCEVLSNEATLSVNSISGTAASTATCEGQTKTIDISEYSVIGNISLYQWQYRAGTSGSFVDISGETNNSIAFTNIQKAAEGFYRCKLTFDNGNGNTCVINTSTSGIKLNVDIPQVPILSGETSICKGANATISASNCSGILTWSTGEIGLTINVSPETTTLYTATCKVGKCTTLSETDVSITVLEIQSIAPSLSTEKLNYCFGETIKLTANNCIGEILWSNGQTGNEINITAIKDFEISAVCQTTDCQSPQSQILNIKVYPVLTPGSIAENTSTNCAGFNPLTISSIQNPSGGTIQWQKAEDCTATNPTWENIVGENAATFNPTALSVSTCYRRMAFDSCNTVYSNITNFNINPDPSISIFADKDSVCYGNSLNLTKSVIGGEGTCDIQWQINKTSSSQSSTAWKNISVLDALSFGFDNPGNDSTFYFRARIDCINSSCNIATSNVVSAVFHPQLSISVPFSDSTICAGANVSISSSGCKGEILWSTGQTSDQINVAPTENATYTVTCRNSCDAISESVNITVVPGIEAPNISTLKLNLCSGETITLNASNCSGDIIWSNGMQGANIDISASTSFSISAYCFDQKCQSPQSQTLNIKVYPVLTPGSIAENTSTNCVGFNPLTISSIQNPSGGTIQWQKAEDCSATNPTWENIVGENAATFNPPALSVSTCYRRMAFDSCNTVYSNIANFNINPDPSISIFADADSVCYGNSLNLTKSVIGGEGTCDIQWQINKTSSSQSSTAWKNISVSDALAFGFDNPGNDSTFYFRARIDCSNSSCNIATSNVVSAVFHPQLSISVPFTDSTICAGANVNISSSGCKGEILWSTGQTAAQINVAPTKNTTYTVTCKNSCDAVSESVNLTVVPGIEAPNISTLKLNYCFGETITIASSNCSGDIIWSNDMEGPSIEITANESFSISAFCLSQNCQSPQSQTLNIKVYPVLTPGLIVENTSTNCAGFNPLTISSIQNPSGGTIQWQKAEDCSATNPTWENITGENSATFNPPALLVSTCFRRMAFDSCNTVYSNITNFNINPDPSISIFADADSVCFGNSLNLTKSVIGGEGICDIQWQINKTSSSQSSTVWKNISVSDALAFGFDNPGNDSTFYFRARIDCSNNSCNIATSNVISAVFHPQLSISVPFTDSTICSGANLSISVSGCKGQILWSTGETSTQINVAPSENTTYTVNCKNSCDAVSESVNITVVPGIEAPNISITQLNYCSGETITLNASNCSGEIIWSNGMQGANIDISASTNFSISAYCFDKNCQSPQSQTLNIKIYPILTPGLITENTSTNCAGFNPLTISSIQNPSGGTIQWQKAEDCSATNPTWENIVGENAATFNPPALSVSTCYRRMAFDSCNTVYSNIANFNINPDPSISIFADKDSVCFGNSLNLTKSVIGGEGTCDIQWQINKASSSQSSTAWKNISVSDVLAFGFDNPGNDSTFYFRARVDCSNSSCNIATSNVVSAVFHPQLSISVPFTDSTICAGANLSISVSGCKGDILWSTGQTSDQINVAPTENTTYTVTCKNSCDAVSESVNITVVPGIEAPNISTLKLNYCFGETITLNASNCSGEIIWSNGMQGASIEISASSNFNISAYCFDKNCQSPQSQILNIKVYPVLTPGLIAENTSTNCAGFNPLTISSIQNPSGGTIQWQKAEDCSATNPTWENIAGENAATFNPPALSESTCYRRMAFDSCNTVNSNITNFNINPDPSISIFADKDSVCFGNSLNLTKSVIGGEGTCDIQWQINKTSSSQSSTAWKNISVSDALAFGFDNPGNDSTFYFRARVDCSNSSCNIATSNVISAVFHPQLSISVPFTDSTICAGANVNISSSGCKGEILWSTGQTIAQINVAPTENTTYTVTCKNSCDAVSESVNITVVPGIEAPINTTPDSVYSPSLLIFTANGQNLKWYESVISTIPLSQTPEVSIPGLYSFWVSQTIGTCQSPRIQITARLIPELAIVTQPLPLTNCYGNTSNFEITAQGGDLNYQWQRKRPDETSFSNLDDLNNYIDGALTEQLKIKSVGNGESPDGTLYRCIIYNQIDEIISEEVSLNVNSVQGSLANQKLCLGNDLNFNLNNTHAITGIPSVIQWQYRIGTGADWLDMRDSGNISGVNSLQMSITELTKANEFQYRCSLLFNSSTGTCTETTDLMTLTVGDYPTKPNDIGFEFCQAEKSPEIELYEPSTIDVIWYPLGSTIGLNKQPSISTENPRDQLFYFSFKNQDECESDKALIHIIINPQPPKPINSTPSSVFEEEGLEFTATGENLKWYTSRTGKTFINYSPTYQKIGSYDHYVSQTSQKGCESERLLIESEIIASFGIATQPSNQANCDNNTVTFSIKTKGELASATNYQWQIKKEGVFVNLEGENAKDLKISDAGVAPHLDGSIYRCLVDNGTKEIISDEVSLKVNTIKGDLSDIKICENESISAQMFGDLIQGTPKTFEWQIKVGSSYNTLFTTSNFDETFIPKPSESGDYRLRVTFFNQGSSTCVRNSNTLKIKVNKNPEALSLSKLDLCQFSNFGKIYESLPPNTILVNLDSSKIENFTISDIRTLNYLAFIKDENTCESPYSKLSINILEAPTINITQNAYVFCQFSEKTKPLKINNLNTFWFKNPEDEDFTENFILLSAENTQSQYAAIEGQNGCISSKTEIKFSLEPCFYDTKADSCISQTGLSLDPNHWNYIYDKNGKIFAAVHPMGQNLGKVSFDIKTTLSKSLKDLNFTDFYPRYFRFTATKVFSSDVKLRFYLTDAEIKNFEKKINEDVLIVNYTGKNIDCDLENNDLSDNYWLETSTFWQKAEKEGFQFVEFNTKNTGEFGLWSEVLPLGNLEGDLNSNNLPQLNIIDFEAKGIYSLQKSKDEQNWFEWIPKIENPLFADQKPFITENFYALIYDFGNGIKTRRNQVKISVPEENLICLVFENPSENRELLKLYFPNVDKTSVKLSNLAGQKIDILSILEKEDYLEIHPQTHIPAGLYTLSSINQNGEQCSVKVWMR